MKAVVFSSVGNVALETLPDLQFSNPPMPSNRSFAEHERGWIKVKLEPSARSRKAAYPSNPRRLSNEVLFRQHR